MALPGPSRTPSMRRLVVIWASVSVLLIIATIVGSPTLFGLVPLAAERTRDYALTMTVFTVLACPVVAGVMVFALYSLWHWRSPSQPQRDGPYLIAGTRIQVAWVAVSALLVALLYTWGLIFLNRADAAPPPGSHVLNVDVTGEQWTWNFTYPQYGNAQSAYLEVPVNRPILFTITSLDVTHSFSVPAWALKEDAVPGQFTYIRVTPDRLGTFDLRCYELCGMFHAYMQSQARVVSPSAFATWVRAQPTGYPWGIGGAGVPNHYNQPPTDLNEPQTGPHKG